MELRTKKRRYNTKTALLLVSRQSLRLPWKDSEVYFEADLYKSRTGGYFLYGKGGILSRFKKRNEDTIVPLEDEEARLICKEFMKPQAYQEEFRM